MAMRPPSLESTHYISECLHTLATTLAFRPVVGLAKCTQDDHVIVKCLISALGYTCFFNIRAAETLRCRPRLQNTETQLAWGTSILRTKSMNCFRPLPSFIDATTLRTILGSCVAFLEVSAPPPLPLNGFALRCTVGLPGAEETLARVLMVSPQVYMITVRNRVVLKHANLCRQIIYGGEVT